MDPNEENNSHVTDHNQPNVEPTQQEQTPQSQEPKVQPTPQQPAVTPEAIAEAVRAGMQQSQPQPQMTQEEINKQLKVWNPDTDFATNVAQAFTPNDEGQVNPENIAKVFQLMHQNQMTQAQTYAQALVQQMQQQVQQQVQPLQTHYQEQQKKQMQSEFTKNYPALKPYESLMQSAAATLQASGANFRTKEEMFPALASSMEQMIKTMNPNFTLNNAPPQAQNNVTPASLLAGGQNNQGSQAPSNGRSASIWG